MKNLLNFISQHPDVVVRPCSTVNAVYLAAHAIEADGSQSSELSPALTSFQAVREWLNHRNKFTTMKTTAAHHNNVPQWISAVVGLSADRYTKRKELRSFVRQNLSAGQATFSHAETARWASAQVQFVRSAYDSARDAFRASFSVYRGVYSGGNNPLHFANR